MSGRAVSSPAATEQAICSHYTEHIFHNIEQILHCWKKLPSKAQFEVLAVDALGCLLPCSGIGCLTAGLFVLDCH